MATGSCLPRFGRVDDAGPVTLEKAAYRCEVCAFELWLPVARLSCSTLGLYDDARFPGRCILVLHEHVEDVTTLAADIAHKLMDDIRCAVSSIRAVTGTERVNWAVLGNVEPHLHVHLVPRRATEPVADRSPWEHPDPASALSPDNRDRLIVALGSSI